MLKRRIKESLAVGGDAVVINRGIKHDNMTSNWEGVPYAALSLVLVQLRYLAFLHQTHHWITKGDPFYGDHLLFERLYGAVTGEIDSIAEKVIGLGSTQNVDIMLQAKQLCQLVCDNGGLSTIPTPDQLVKQSLAAELSFIECIEHAVENLQATGCMTRGLDNMLAGISDTHEGHVYLLKQRLSK